MLDQMVNHQAQIIAYINDYVLMIFTTAAGAAVAVADAPAARHRLSARERVTSGDSHGIQSE